MARSEETLRPASGQAVAIHLDFSWIATPSSVGLAMTNCVFISKSAGTSSVSD